MTTSDLIGLGQWLATVAAGVLLWTARKGGADATALARLTALETRMDTAGKAVSDLSDVVQALTERHRLIFLTRDESKIVIEQSQADRAALHRDLETLWSVVRREPNTRTRRTD